MRVLSHRGYWKEPDEKNSSIAFMRSLEFGFGLETDVRDCAGRLLVSHDMPTGREVAFDDLLEMFQNKDLPLALNIKADGLVACIQKALQAYQIKDWFAFDMSVPDMRSYLDALLPVFARVSEVEKDPPWIEEVAGIWCDSFSGVDYDANRIASFLKHGKRVCIVSPELHNRPYQVLWKAIEPLRDQADLMLCTDYPEQARAFFMTDHS